jgi:putative membrane protein
LFQSSQTGRHAPPPFEKSGNNAVRLLFCLQSGNARISQSKGPAQMKISQYLPALTVAATLWMSPALAEDSAQTFVDKAAVGGMFEVESSQLALKMSDNADVKHFADMMVNDHGKANAELKSLAEQEHLTLPAALDEEHAAMLKTLSRAGGQFDVQYAKAQLDAHKAAVELFQNYASNGENKTLQKFAVQTLPTLHGHLEAIKDIGAPTAATK